jgi:hypothetical protein
MCGMTVPGRGGSAVSVPLKRQARSARRRASRCRKIRQRTQPLLRCQSFLTRSGGNTMHSIIYIIGLIVVIMAVLSFFGLR